jgi:hypothetical protein
MMGDSMTEARRKSLPWSAGVLGCGCATVVGSGPRVGRWEGGLLGCWAAGGEWNPASGGVVARAGLELARDWPACIET